MEHSNKAQNVWMAELTLWSAAVALPLFVLFAGRALLGEPGPREIRSVLTDPKVTHAVNAAVRLQPGRVLGVEVENAASKPRIDVEIVSRDGSEYEIRVDAQTYEVLFVEQERKNNGTAVSRPAAS